MFVDSSEAYKSILSHSGTGAETSLEVEWVDGTVSVECIRRFEGSMDWPVLKYAECFGLLQQPNWKRFADRKSTRLNSSHESESRMPSSA